MFHEEFDDYSSNKGIPKKICLKWLELPIEKFNSAVPHFVELIETHNANLTKLKNLKQWDGLQKEHANSLKTVSQLTTLLNDMDHLRSQVIDCETFKFDKLILRSKQSALKAIRSYQDIRKKSHVSVSTQDDEPYSDQQDDESYNDQQDEKLQIIADLSEDIKQKEMFALSMDRVHQDVEQIHALFQDLAQLVHEQGENVEQIEEHIDTAHINVVEGENLLHQAVKYKRGMLPLMGAVMGSMMGGPVGFIAGFKLGSLTAIGLGFLGFTGGKMLKTYNEESVKDVKRQKEELIS